MIHLQSLSALVPFLGPSLETALLREANLRFAIVWPQSGRKCPSLPRHPRAL